MSDFSVASLGAMLAGALGEQAYSPQIQRALALAHRGHAGQFRDEPIGNAERSAPYILHPVGTALLCIELMKLASLHDSLDDIVSACLTHDLLEDTEISAAELERVTSRRTADVVLALTKPLLPGDVRRQERDEQFVTRIHVAGPTAAFVKVCDFLHNISRPERTPCHILAKAIRKGQSSYRRLLQHEAFSSALTDEYLRRLDAAEQYFLKTCAKAAEPRRFTLDEAVRHCVNHADRKVLEQHDILEIIRTVTGASHVGIMATEAFVAQFVLSGQAAQRGKAKAVNALRRGELRCEEVQTSDRSAGLDGLTKIVSTSMSAPPATGDHERLFAALNAGSASWVTPHALTMLTVFLSERLRQMEKNRDRDLAAEVSALGLVIDSGLVRSLKLSVSDLRQLRALLDHADFVRNSLMHMLGYELSDLVRGGDIVSIESRLKTPVSVAAKMLARRYQHFMQVEDLVGVRLVCLSPSASRSVVARVESVLGEYVRRLSPDGTHFPSGRRVESDAGYGATHLCFNWPATGVRGTPIACEIQIRTIYEDAWARVSHFLAYKRLQEPNTSDRSTLAELARLRNLADALLDDEEPGQG